ncbi:MAG: hypothetical protein Q9218_000888 [Villophora microphyllina]
MADSLQQLESEDDCITPRQSTTIDLRYPSIPVNGTPNSWLSNSLLVPMASHQDEDSVRSGDDTMSSFDGSAYDFVEDASYETTDDEDHSGMTESVSVVGESTLSMIGNQDMERTLSKNSTQEQGPEDLTLDGIRGPTTDSASSNGAACREPSPQTTRLQVPNNDKATGRMSIQFDEVYHGEGIHRLESPSMPPGFAVTVRQRMLGSTFSFEQPYTMLYVGDVAVREQIVAKIRTAIEVAKKHGVGCGSAHLPHSTDCGPKIVVYHCTDASFGRMDNGHDTIDLALEGHAKVQSFWDGSKFSITEDWEMPDLAIFCLSEADSVIAKQTRRFARSFMARHHIPSFVVNDRSAWDRPSEAMVIDHLTPHMCLQTDESPLHSSRIVKRLPIDLATFLGLNDLQMNQNLAYLAKTHHKSGRNGHGQINQASGVRFANPDENMTKRNVSSLKAVGLHNYAGIPTIWLTYLLLFLAGVGMYMAAGTVVVERSIFSAATGNLSKTHTASSSGASIASPAVATPIPLLNSKSVTLQGLTTQELGKSRVSQRALTSKSTTGLAALLLEHSPAIVNKSEHFEIQVLGGAHLILRPPHWFTRLRKTPKLLFKVTQGSRMLKHQVSTLFDGVYALELPHDDARGQINITVWTESKPKIHETLHADFGLSWLDTAGWKKAATALGTSFRRDLKVVHTSLMASCVHSHNELHALIRKTLGRADHLRTKSSMVGKASVERMRTTMQTLLALESRCSSDISQTFQQKKEAAFKNTCLHTKRLQRQVSDYMSGGVHAASIYLQAAPTAYRIHLRNTQKKALKLWWGVMGLPNHSVVTVDANHKSPEGSWKSKRRPCVG